MAVREEASRQMQAVLASGEAAGALAANALLREAQRSLQITDASRSASERYRRACAAMRTDPTPVTEEKLGGVLFYEVDVAGHAAHALPTFLSGLKALAQARGDWALSELEYSRLRGSVSVLERMYPGAVERLAPMRDEVLIAVRAYLAPYLARRELYALQWWAMLTLGYAACLRSVELLSLCGEQLRVIRLPGAAPGGGSMEALRIHNPLRKATLLKADANVDVTVVPGRRKPAGAELDALAAIKAYAERAGIVLGSMASSGRMFPRRRQSDGAVLSPAYGEALARADLRSLLQRAGVANPAGFGLRSLRSGGATYYLGTGMTWTDVSRIGGWTSAGGMAPYDRGGERAAMVAARSGK